MNTIKDKTEELCKRNDLVGNFWLCDRDTTHFNEFLEEMGIEQCVREGCVEKMKWRFRDDVLEFAYDERYHGTLSKFQREFQNNKIDNDLYTVPGIGPGNKKKLERHDIKTTSQLVGQFWIVDRDTTKFIEFLEDMDIRRLYARECAEAMERKFRDV